MLSDAELNAALAEVQGRAWTPEAKEALEAILQELRKEGIVPGDRRQVQSVQAAQAAAWLDGAGPVQPTHLEVLAHTLWDDPQEQPEKTARVVARIANPTGMRITELLGNLEEVLAAVEPGKMGSLVSAIEKLKEIGKALDGLKEGNGRLERAREYTKRKIKELKLKLTGD